MNFIVIYSVLSLISEVCFVLSKEVQVIPYFKSKYVNPKNVSYHVSNTHKRQYVYDIQGEYFTHLLVVDSFYDNRKNWKTSNIGTLLFKNVDTDTIIRLSTAKKNKSFIVLIWNEWSVLFTDSDKSRRELLSSMEGCSVNNCIFTRNKKIVKMADAILVNVYKGEIPHINQRNESQIWIFYSVESPMHTFMGNMFAARRLVHFSDIFNWTMTYRSDADIPIPYGRVVPLPTPLIVDLSNQEDALLTLIPYWRYKRRDVLVAILMSNCGFKKRMRFLRGLSKYIRIDVHGNCAKKRKFRYSCVGHYRTDCPVLRKYLFYLVLENSNCRQYLTEKIFYNAFSNGAIPIVWATPLEDCKKLLAPDSYIHVNDYGSYQELVGHIKYISQNNNEILHYHKWRKHFYIINEHGYFGTKSVHFCRLCEALNYNDYVPHSYNYDELKMFFDSRILCH